MLNKNGVNVGYVNKDGVDIDDKQDIFGNLEDAIDSWMDDHDVKCGEDGHVHLAMLIDGLIWEFKKDKMAEESVEYKYKEFKKLNQERYPEMPEDEIEAETDDDVIDYIKHKLCLIK